MTTNRERQRRGAERVCPSCRHRRAHPEEICRRCGYDPASATVRTSRIPGDDSFRDGSRLTPDAKDDW